MTQKKPAPRENVKYALTVRGMDSRGVPFEESTVTENISLSGARILTKRDLMQGSVLEISAPVRISVEAERIYRNATRARVVWKKKSTTGHYQVGIKFGGLKEGKDGKGKKGFLAHLVRLVNKISG
ncbi:MAG: PilZ domain-containing protein [Acidobacteria bacterium]|nr:PilZ domain-containing protein [Acidobacteriota bacterium]